jgi:D-3-phosphoglycerate dehydrogenase / 2-oxoglutarate reductase
MREKPSYQTIENIIFDFDGVILDSLDCKTEAFYQMYLPYGEDIAKKVKKYHILNGGVSRFEKFKTWHKQFLNVELSKKEIQDLANQFSDLVMENVINSNPIPGAIEFIKRYSKDFNFFIISGTPDDEIKKICEAIGIASHFKEILGSPKNKKIWCSELKVKYDELRNDNTIFLGDALSDYEAAIENNFFFALREADYNEQIFHNLELDVKFQNFHTLTKNLEFPKMKILVTTTSFQDSPGEHHDLLNSQDWNIDFLRGPLKESELIDIIQHYDGVLCGDDEYTRGVIKKGSEGKLKALAKYGVGLDKIDLKAAKEFGIKVSNCPGINQVSVAEHVLALLLTFEKNIHIQYNSVQNGSWTRLVGREIRGKKIGIIGLGSIGKELSIIMINLGLNVLAFDIAIDKEFLKQNPSIKECSLDELVINSDYISLHLPLTDQTRDLINESLIAKMKQDVIIVNSARGELVHKRSIKLALEQCNIRGYLCDVLDEEPIKPNEELLGIPGVIITPHVGSRTKDNIVNQGIQSLKNLIESIKS